MGVLVGVLVGRGPLTGLAVWFLVVFLAGRGCVRFLLGFYGERTRPGVGRFLFWVGGVLVWLVVFGAEFEEGLGVRADGADFWGGFSDVDVATFATHPHTVAVAGEDDSFFDVFEEGAVAFHVFAFDGTYLFEFFGDFGESFFAGDSCEFDVHVFPFVFFAGSGVGEVSGGFGDIAVVEVFEPDFGVGVFVFGGFGEDSADLLVAVFLGLLGVERVFDTCLRFAGEGGFQAFFSASSFEVFHK